MVQWEQKSKVSCEWLQVRDKRSKLVFPDSQEFSHHWKPHRSVRNGVEWEVIRGPVMRSPEPGVLRLLAIAGELRMREASGLRTSPGRGSTSKLI